MRQPLSLVVATAAVAPGDRSLQRDRLGYCERHRLRGIVIRDGDATHRGSRDAITTHAPTLWHSSDN